MTLTAKKLYEGQPAATNTTAYTCPSNSRVRITKATATNDTTTAIYLTGHLVPSGGSVGDAYLAFNQKVIGSKETVVLEELEGHVLDPSDFVNLIAEVAAQISVQISGVLFT